MGRRVKMSAAQVSVFAAMNESDAASAAWDMLPIKARASIWGDEIYFSTPIEHAGDPGASDVVPLGTVGYWPPGKAICLFFGPTPVSKGEEPRGASAITVIGRIEGDCKVLKSVPSGAAITIERA